MELASQKPKKELKWESFKEELVELYISRDLCLKQLMGIMEERHSFQATYAFFKSTRSKIQGQDRTDSVQNATIRISIQEMGTSEVHDQKLST